jgi:hypothetical protein
VIQRFKVSNPADDLVDSKIYRKKRPVKFNSDNR